MNYEEKKQALKNYLLELAAKDIVVAFSGGVDSSLLLYMCCEAARKTGSKVYAVTMQTDLHPHGDVDIARKVAEEAGAQHVVVQLNELDQAGIRMNPEDRCYRCKRCLFGRMQGLAEELGAAYVVEGTNEDDLHIYRPSHKALAEMGILSPYAKIGVTKAEIRQLADEYHVSTAHRASTPCMATRFPYNTELSSEMMMKVAGVEEWMREKGFYNVRLRVHGDVGRLEVDRADMSRFVEHGEEIVARIKQTGIDYVTLDLEGYRKGSMDIHVKK